MQGSAERVKPKGIRRFKKEPKYPHNRSEGMTHRRNAGSKFQREK